MTVADNLALVRKAYAAFNAGDIETLSTLYAKDVSHAIPGNAPQLSGAHKGVENVMAMYGKLGELSSGTMSVELEDVLSDGDGRVIAIHQATGTRNGKSLSDREALLITIVDGKVAEIQDFFRDIDANDAFWG
jgi:ketosteroid isomerase-like protein